MTKKNIPQNFENTHLIFYELLADGTKDVVWFKAVTQAKTKDGELLNFYAVPASKFGIRIPKNATHWCLAVLGGKKADVLLEDIISEPMTKNEYHLFDNIYVHFNRFNKNVKFMIGMSSEAYGKLNAKSKKKFIEISNQLN